MQNRTSHQVTELQNLAEIQFSRANRLGDELNKIRKDNKDMRRKVRFVYTLDPYIVLFIAFLDYISFLRFANHIFWLLGFYTFIYFFSCNLVYLAF